MSTLVVVLVFMAQPGLNTRNSVEKNSYNFPTVLLKNCSTLVVVLVFMTKSLKTYFGNELIHSKSPESIFAIDSVIIFSFQ